MPVLGMNMCERPGNTIDAKTVGYLDIFVNVARIVVVNELVLERLAKNDPRNCRQKNADADCQRTAVRPGRRYYGKAILHVRSKIS